MALCVVWDLIGLAMVILGVIIVGAPDMFKDTWESASRLTYHVLFGGILTAVLASFGFAGARSNGPTLKICFYFYIVIVVFVALLLVTVSAFWLREFLETIVEASWDKLRTKVPAEMTGLSSKAAIAYIEKFLNDNLVYFLPAFIFVWLSVIGGVIVSGVKLTCRNITGTLDFFASILLLLVGSVFLFVGSFISRIFSTSSKLYIYSLPALLPGICMLVSGVIGVVHLCKCVTTRGKIVILHLHLGVAALSTLTLVSLGIYFLTQAKIISEAIDGLTEKEFGDLLQGISLGGSWDTANARKLVTDAARIFGGLCLVVSGIMILTILTGAFVLYKTKRAYKESEVERAGQRMALSTRYKHEADHEWMQEDVEVLPPSHPKSIKYRRQQQVEMANMNRIPVAQPVDAGMAQPVNLNAFHSNGGGNRL